MAVNLKASRLSIAVMAGLFSVSLSQVSMAHEHSPKDGLTSHHSLNNPQLKSGVDLRAVDPKVRPQDDFYSFANGSWLAKTKIPSIYSGYSIYTQVYEDTEKALQQIITDSAKGQHQPGSEAQKVSDFYASWLAQEDIQKQGLKAIAPELEKINSITDSASLLNVMAQLSTVNITMPFLVYVEADLKNSGYNIAYLEQDGLTLPNRDYYLDEDNKNFAKVRQAMPYFIAQMLEFTGETQPDKQAREIYELERQLAKLHWAAVDNRNAEKTYNPYQAKELNKVSSLMDWSQMIHGLGIDSDKRVVVRQPSYFKGLAKLIKETNLDTWKSYLSYQLLDNWSSHLPKAIDQTSFAFHGTTLSGQTEQRPRWKRGVGLLNRVLGEVLGKMYVADYFPVEAKTRMKTLVQNVLSTFEHNIDHLDWMSEQTRKAAKAKLATFTAKIGYPDKWRDYSRLVIKRGDHMGNMRRSYVFEHHKQMSKLAQPVDRSEWFMTPQTVNAYYDPTKNEIVFPAARLQPPFFQLNADDAINYGAVGGVIGHEISHGFDDEGSRFDGDGNLKNWWGEADRKAFESRTKLLVEQYNQFEPIKGMHINGQLTLGENIGDLSGLTMAYKAYINSLNGQEAPVIDGFTGQQRFFIGYAMSRRGKDTDQRAVARLASDPHSPLRYRVNGVVQNMPEFYEAFKVSKGDAHWLEKDQRVKLW
jgi:putative endopeptidase